MSTTIKFKQVRIRKAHRCFACLRRFEPPTKMWYWVGINDGDFNYVYTCNTCENIIKHSHEDEFPEGFVNEMLFDGQTPEMILTTLNGCNTKDVRT